MRTSWVWMILMYEIECMTVYSRGVHTSPVRATVFQAFLSYQVEKLIGRNRCLRGRTESPAELGSLVGLGWALGTAQLLVVDSRSIANSGLITLKTIEMPVPSKLDMAFTICAWWRHLHHICLSVKLDKCTIYLLFKLMLPVTFPYVSCHSVSVFFLLLLSTALSPFFHDNRQFESLLGVITFAHVSCWRTFVLKPAQKDFDFDISLSFLFITRPF